jgi:uncharacterized protein HemY
VGDHAKRVSRARALLKKADFQGVVELMLPWLAAHGDDASAWETLGAAYYGMHLWEAAEDAARHAIAIRPNSARAWSNLGTLLRKLGRYEEARQAQVRAIELDPDYDRARLELKRVHEAIELEAESSDELFDSLG